MSLLQQQKTIQEFLDKENVKIGTRKIQDLVAKLNGYRSRTHMPLKAEKLQEKLSRLESFLKTGHDFNKDELLAVLNGQTFYYYLYLDKEYIWFESGECLKSVNKIVQYARDHSIISNEDANNVELASMCDKSIFEAKKEVPRVKAEVYTDDRMKEVVFDCTDYFLRLDEDSLESLAYEWITMGDNRANQETDNVALWYDGINEEVSELFSYLGVVQNSGKESIGFTCGILEGFEELMEYLEIDYDKD